MADSARKKKVRLDKLEACVGCGGNSFTRDYTRAECICTSCGLVLSEHSADRGPEWRAFTAEERNARARTGAPMRLTIAEQPLGMQSEEFEKARLTAVELVGQVQEETSSPHFWPALEDNRGFKIMIDLQTKLDESYAHQLNLLNLYKIAADAFRSGRDAQAPSSKEMTEANELFARVLDQMGTIAGKLTKHYRISAQEYHREL